MFTEIYSQTSPLATTSQILNLPIYSSLIATNILREPAATENWSTLILQPVRSDSSSSGRAAPSAPPSPHCLPVQVYSTWVEYPRELWCSWELSVSGSCIAPEHLGKQQPPVWESIRSQYYPARASYCILQGQRAFQPTCSFGEKHKSLQRGRAAALTCRGATSLWAWQWAGLHRQVPLAPAGEGPEDPSLWEKQRQEQGAKTPSKTHGELKPERVTLPEALPEGCKCITSSSSRKLRQSPWGTRGHSGPKHSGCRGLLQQQLKWLQTSQWKRVTSIKPNNYMLAKIKPFTDFTWIRRQAGY